MVRSRTQQCRTTRPLVAIIAAALPPHAAADGLVDTLVRRFSESDFQFVRAQSNAPFPPLAAITATGYQETHFRMPDGSESDATAQQSSISQYALVPIPVGQRDAFAIGEWVSWTRFDLENSMRDDFDVYSVSVPVGWIRQSTPDWQLAAFVAPLGHKTSGADWYWETLGGAFARNIRNERLAWIVGFYFDVAPLEDFYTPYLGAVYVVNEQWTLNAIMPWPSITYAPSTDTLFRFGVSPSGASWSVEQDEQRPRLNLSTWNIGFSAEHRLGGSVWLGLEVGASCLRGLSIAGGDWEGPDTRLDRTGFALLTLNVRPSVAPGAR